MKRFMGKQPALKGVFKDFVEVFIGIPFPQTNMETHDWPYPDCFAVTWASMFIRVRGILVVGTMASLQNFAWFTIRSPSHSRKLS